MYELISRIREIQADLDLLADDIRKIDSGRECSTSECADKAFRQVAEDILNEVKRLASAASLKEWYSPNELAEALNKSPFTIRENWCNAGRIECEKDPDTGKWRIPGSEYLRLTSGGQPAPKGTKVTKSRSNRKGSVR